MLSILEYINQLLWGFPVLILLSSAHLYFTAKLKFPQKLTLKAIRLSVTPEKEGKGANLSGFAALATTLAATLGTGNIVGVSTAIAIGGPGALFWCWITGILGMATCYAECYLSVLFKKQKPDKTYVGGPMYVLEKGLHCRGLGIVYALCALFAAFGVGCTTQSSAITEAVNTIAPVSPHIIGILAAFTAGLVILGGVKSIGKFCTRMVPALGFFYIACCLYLLVLNRDFLLSGISLIVSSAFRTKAAAGGFIGSTLQSAARFGIARGLVTHCRRFLRNQGSQKTKPDFHDGGFLGYCSHVCGYGAGYRHQHSEKPGIHPGLWLRQPHLRRLYLPSLRRRAALVPGSGGLRHYHPHRLVLLRGARRGIPVRGDRDYLLSSVLYSHDLYRCGAPHGSGLGIYGSD